LFVIRYLLFVTFKDQFNFSMHILIAPNAFKNALPADEVAEAISMGLDESSLKHSSECFPVGDGGDGTGALIAKRSKGAVQQVEVEDPLGRKINASYSIIQGDTAVIEMAAASGLRLLATEELNPLFASSFGTGQLIKDALDKNVKKIILAIGGSATVDGGCGILQALGIRFLKENGEVLTNLPEQLHQLSFVDTALLDQRIKQTDLIILCDVENKLLGPNGSAAVFGPQKGATPEVVVLLEQGLGQLASVTLHQFGIPLADIRYGGAAGGVAAGLHAYVEAKLVNGINYFLEITGFEASLKKADLIITGEGSIDEQTLQGKGPYGVAKLAAAHQIPVIGLAGKLPDKISDGLRTAFTELININKEKSSLVDALGNTKKNLIRTAKEIGERLAKEISNR